MKTFTTLLFLAPALVLASPTQNEVYILSKAGTATPEVNELAQSVSNANKFVSLMAEHYTNAAECCNQTPCFVGCPVGGVPRVSFSITP